MAYLHLKKDYKISEKLGWMIALYSNKIIYVRVQRYHIKIENCLLLRVPRTW